MVIGPNVVIEDGRHDCRVMLESWPRNSFEQCNPCGLVFETRFGASTY